MHMVFTVWFILYFLPSCIALRFITTDLKKFHRLWLINLTLGWTVIGWLYVYRTAMKG